jgi:hypothetical protein
VIRNESTTNLNSLRTPPISPALTSPTRGFVHGHYYNSGGDCCTNCLSIFSVVNAWNLAVSQLRIPEGDKDQPVFQEVDLGERRFRDYLHSADKENIPPPGHGLKRLTISPGANESTVSIARIPKVSMMRCHTPFRRCSCFFADLPPPDAPTPFSQEVIGATDSDCHHYE